jgi:hypothetical protein
MKNLVALLKKNWLVIVLVGVIAVLFGRGLPTGLGNQRGVFVEEGGFGGVDMAKTSSIGMMPPVFQEPAPVTGQDRLVVTNTNLSLKVREVRRAIDEISMVASRLGGFMVDSSLSQPEEGAGGNISVRIPSDKLVDGLNEIRALGERVVSENVVGTDVTAEFVDIQARLDTLNKTKAKFDQIMAGATSVPDLLNLQRELINLQSQIDSLVGQRKYLEQTAKLSLVTVYLATDELALPYAPTQSWRPSVIFKEAVRALIGSLRGVGTAVIWIVVYAPVWLPMMLLLWWLKRRFSDLMK